MYISQPVSLTELYIENDSLQNKYKGLLNANFQDYVEALRQGGEFQIKQGQLKNKVASLSSGIGMAFGVFGGPASMALGYSIGNTIGKYLGNVIGDRIYGRAIYDMSEIAHETRVRHSQIAASIAFQNQMDGAIDTLRQNENKRKKDDLQAMQV